MFGEEAGSGMVVREYVDATELLQGLQMELRTRYGAVVPLHLLRNQQMVLQRLAGWQRSHAAGGREC